MRNLEKQGKPMDEGVRRRKLRKGSWEQGTGKNPVGRRRQRWHDGENLKFPLHGEKIGSGRAAGEIGKNDSRGRTNGIRRRERKKAACKGGSWANC